MEVVVIRKTGGFYNVFDDDAIIISYLTGYKLVGGKCGFPLGSLNRVLNLLEDNSISYVVRVNMEDVNSKNYKKVNKYSKILEKGKKKLDVDYRVSDMVNKINLLSYDKLCELLDVIEEYCNE